MFLLEQEPWTPDKDIQIYDIVHGSPWTSGPAASLVNIATHPTDSCVRLEPTISFLIILNHLFTTLVGECSLEKTMLKH